MDISQVKANSQEIKQYTIACSLLVVLVSKYVHKDWTINTRASNHMTSQFELLDRIKIVPKFGRK